MNAPKKTDPVDAPQLAADGVAKLGMFLPPVIVVSILLLFFLTPISEDQPLPLWRYMYAHWLHHIGFGLLFVFLVTVQYLQIEAKLRITFNHPMTSIARTYYRMWLITELLPAPSALLLGLSGFRLIRETGVSLETGWVFWLVTFFGVLFWDGIFFFTNDARALKNEALTACHQGKGAAEFSTQSRNFMRDTLLFLHFASFPFIFQIGALRPDCWSPLRDQMKNLNMFFLKYVPAQWASSWAHVATAITVFLVMLPAIFCVRISVRGIISCFSRTNRLPSLEIIGQAERTSE
jgi:uncharacterized membrane protein